MQNVMHAIESTTMPAGLYNWEKLLSVLSQIAGTGWTLFKIAPCTEWMLAGGPPCQGFSVISVTSTADLRCPVRKRHSSEEEEYERFFTNGDSPGLQITVAVSDNS